jgi:hypothetical protein
MIKLKSTLYASAIAFGLGVPFSIASWKAHFALAQANRAIQTVIAQGVGKDVESAAKNAAENALTQVVGTFIQTDKILNKRTEINNGIREQSRSIETKTREYSQGSIKSFELLETSQENGLFRVAARVEVRIEDFKAFLEKYAEGETPVGPELSPQVGTQAKKRQNAQDIVTNNILLPLLEGKATRFALGKPQIYSEWVRSQNQITQKSADQVMTMFHAPRETIVIPVQMVTDVSFLQNTRQTLESIAFAKKRVDTALQEGLCYGPANKTAEFDRRRDGTIAISPAAGSALLDVYSLKDIRQQNPKHGGSSLTEVIENWAFSGDTSFSDNYHTSFYPDLSNSFRLIMRFCANLLGLLAPEGEATLWEKG